MRVLAFAGAGALASPSRGRPDHLTAGHRPVSPADDQGLPQGASSYIVASDNWAIGWGSRRLRAPDRNVVTVAARSPAGVAAGPPSSRRIFPYRVIISVALVVLLMIGNLRWHP